MHIKLLKAVCILTIAASAIGAFIGLSASSFWLDEFFTAYHGGPAVSDLPELLARTGENAHPPAYFWITWFTWKLTSIDYILVSRGISAILAVAVLPVLYFGLPVRFSQLTRLCACAFAVTSLVWFNYAQEARSYALVLLLTTALLVLAIHIREAWKNGQPHRGLSVTFVFVAMLGGLTHFYAVHIAVAIVAALFLYASTFRQRFHILFSGIVLPLPALLFVAWQLKHLRFDPQSTWFEVEFGFVIQQILHGLAMLSGSKSAIVLMLTAVGSWLALRMNATNAPDEKSALAEVQKDLGFLLLASTLATVSAITVSIAAVPHFSFRFMAVLAPAFWIGVALVIGTALERLRGTQAVIWTSILTVSLLLGSSKIAWRNIPDKQPWREMANAVAMLSECESRKLPVVWLEGRGFVEPPEPTFYGYYLDDGPTRNWMPIPRDLLQDGEFPSDFRRLVKRRLGGEDPCPLLLWSGHTPNRRTMARVKKFINEELAASNQVTLMVQSFQPPQATGLRLWLEGDSVRSDGSRLSDPRRAEGFLILASPAENNS